MNNIAWLNLINKISNFKFQKGLTSFVNPYSMSILEKHPEIIECINYWHIDGISLVNILSPYFVNPILRYSFDDTSLAPIVFDFARNNNCKIAIVGTMPGIIDKAVSNIELKYNIKISYYRNGYFSDKNSKVICQQQIINENIDIIICGMGTPLQEKFLIEIAHLGWNGYGFTCGGYLHQIANSVSYYPNFFNKFNLRWLFRIFDEPKLIKRYIVDYSIFYFKYLKFREYIKILRISE